MKHTFTLALSKALPAAALEVLTFVISANVTPDYKILKFCNVHRSIILRRQAFIEEVH